MATKKKTAEAATEPVQEPDVPCKEPEEATQTADGEHSESAQETVIAEGVAFVEYAVTPPGGLRLRAEPRLDAPMLAVLPCGAGVWMDAHSAGEAEWINVRTGTLSGWVMTRYLAPMADHGAE